MIDIKNIQKKVAKSLRPIATHHIFIVFVFVISFIAYTLYTVDSVLSQPPDAQYASDQQSEAISTKFDEKTIDKVNMLKNRQENSSTELPTGRINPFTE